jgi:hypothetical protein
VTHAIMHACLPDIGENSKFVSYQVQQGIAQQDGGVLHSPITWGA